MAGAGGGTRPAVVAFAVAAIALASVLLWRSSGEPRPQPEASADAPERVEAASIPQYGTGDRPATSPPGDGGSDPSEGVFDARALAWSKVDLEAVREALPDNSYWERSMPTSDPEVLRAREQERSYWEAQYGKVLSNTASEAEVRDYYAHRQRIATDAVEFSSHLLDHYAEVLPERDVGLLQLARRLNLARLEQLPRDLRDALERREAHAEARRAWLAQQQLFEEDDAAATEPD